MKDKIIDAFEKDNGFIKNQNIKVLQLDNNISVLECEISENNLNTIGIAHGGALFGLADTAAGALAFMTGKTCVTTSGNINYLKPAIKGKITATAKALKVGKNIGYYIVNIENIDKELLAVATINMSFKN